MDDKYLYDEDGNFIGTVSNSSPYSGSYSWIWDSGPEEFRYRYSAMLESTTKRVDKLSQDLEDANRRNDMLQVELLSKSLRLAKKELRRVKSYPRRRMYEKASRAFAVALIVAILLWLWSCTQS